jgi:hypothetical protein
MPGLSASRWASKLSTTTTTKTTTYYSSISDLPSSGAAPTSNGSTGSRSSLDELTRYTKIVRRLKWKLPYLAAGYQQAVDQAGPDQANVAEAELMFKLDFFEYYMLLERALVHLLGVFGISVSREFSQRHLQALAVEREIRTGQPGTINSRSSHRYHANVLEALDNIDNPLHAALGTGDVRRQLARAKDLRNLWKNADDAGAKPVQITSTAASLESYDLERILTTIFAGFDQGFVIAEQYVLEERRTSTSGGGDMNMRDANGAPQWTVTDEEQWEFMVDAMDWESV